MQWEYALWGLLLPVGLLLYENAKLRRAIEELDGVSQRQEKIHGDLARKHQNAVVWILNKIDRSILEKASAGDIGADIGEERQVSLAEALDACRKRLDELEKGAARPDFDIVPECEEIQEEFSEREAAEPASEEAEEPSPNFAPLALSSDAPAGEKMAWTGKIIGSYCLGGASEPLELLDFEAEISPPSRKLLMACLGENGTLYVSASFQGENASEAAAAKEGQTVSVRGSFKGFGDSGYWEVESCEMA